MKENLKESSFNIMANIDIFLQTEEPYKNMPISKRNQIYDEVLDIVQSASDNIQKNVEYFMKKNQIFWVYAQRKKLYLISLAAQRT